MKKRLWGVSDALYAINEYQRQRKEKENEEMKSKREKPIKLIFSKRSKDENNR